MSATRDAAIAFVATGGSAYKGDPDVILMRDRSYFFMEGEGFATIDVMRLGDCAAEVKVGYSTAKGDGAVANGSDYTAVHGTLTFAPGDGIESFKVPITNDSQWETMEHFDVVLVAIESGNAVMGGVTRSVVYIVDDDTYPQNFKCLDDGKQPGGWTLLWGFIKERWAHRHPKPIKSMMCLCYGSIHAVIAIVVPLLIIDNCIKPKHMDWIYVGVLCAVYLASDALKWYLHIKFMDWRGNSGTRKDLRNWLVMKYVYFSEAVHLEIDNTHFLDASINMVEETVKNGWFQHFLLVAAIFDVCIQLALAVYVTWHAIVPVAFLVPVIAISICLKQDTFQKLVNIRMVAEDAWMGELGDIFENWMVINSYGVRDERASAFKKVYDDFYTKHRASRFFQLSYQWIAKYANDAALASVFMFGAKGAIDGVITIGEFVALLKIFPRVGNKIVRIGNILIKMQRGTEALRRVSELLNNPIGVTEELKQQKQQAEKAAKAFEDAFAASNQPEGLPQAPGAVALTIDGPKKAAGRMRSEFNTADTSQFAVLRREAEMTAIQLLSQRLCATSGWECGGLDSNQVVARFCGGWTSDMVKAALTIRLDDVGFAYQYPKSMPQLDCDVLCVRRLSGVIPLGHIVLMVPEVHSGTGAAVTHGGDGMLTLMKLITGQLYANQGELLVPPHLDTLLVHQEPMVLNVSLLKNLNMGKPNASEDFIWKVALELGLSPKLIGKSGLKCGCGGQTLRLADRQVVCIARALIADPHVLVVFKLAATFSQLHAAQVFSVLQDWQKRRGLWAVEVANDARQAPVQTHVLNTRTLIFSLAHHAAADVPDITEIVATLIHEVGCDEIGPDCQKAARGLITLVPHQPSCERPNSARMVEL
jgi:ABC-type multidrug transport system fused ATPase/permease subunit